MSLDSQIHSKSMDILNGCLFCYIYGITIFIQGWILAWFYNYAEFTDKHHYQSYLTQIGEIWFLIWCLVLFMLGSDCIAIIYREDLHH